VSISEIILAEPPATALRRQREPAALPTLPDVAPGQLWLVEASAVDGAPSAPARHAVDGANVVIYDRALAPLLADMLPFGSYAEPAPVGEGAGDGSGDAAAARCVRFARDGWSVARLLPSRLPRRERAARVRAFVDELAAAKAPGGLRVTVLAEAADGICERADASLDGLGDIVSTYPRDSRLTIVIEAFGDRVAVYAVAANGLAG
jgi:hypothetical protein